MDSSAYGSLQILQTSKILRPNGLAAGLKGGLGAKEVPDSDTDYRSSVLCLYTTGFQGNALVHHNSIKVNLDNSEENLQMTLKVAGKFCLPVLQSGLFSINFSPKGEERRAPSGISPNYSFLDFTIQPSILQGGQTVSITNVAELSMNRFLLTTAAKIIQSEYSSTPILLWSDIHDDSDTPIRETEDNEDQSEQTNNSLVINMSVPSVRLQLGGPKHGIPSTEELCVDSSLIYGLVEAWRPLIESLVVSVKGFWRNKIIRDRQLMLSLITAAMETTYYKKVSL